MEAKTARDDEDDDDEDDDEDSDDVEASLDVILKERLVVADDDDERRRRGGRRSRRARRKPAPRCCPNSPASSCASRVSSSNTRASWRTKPACCAGTASDLASLPSAGQDRPVTDSHSPLETVLDLFVYAPVGLALTAAEEIPKLAAKGRAQLGGQLAIAKVVGQFAVAQGRRQINKRMAPSPTAAAPAAPAGCPSAAAPAPASTGASETTFEELLASADWDPDAAAMSGAAQTAQGQAPDGQTADGQSGGRFPGGCAGSERPGDSGLRLPGRLAGRAAPGRLAEDELAAVGAYESAHRGRRTILTRVRQLQRALSSGGARRVATATDSPSLQRPVGNGRRRAGRPTGRGPPGRHPRPGDRSTRDSTLARRR